MIGRFLNVMLVPLYTRVFLQEEYGIITQVYAYIAFLNILFTYGLETAFFRFFQTEKEKRRVFSTSVLSILGSSIVFALVIILFSQPIAGFVFQADAVGAMDHSQFAYYIKIFAGILALDAIAAIPFARLRQENKAKRFALIRLTGIAVNIGLNVFFLIVCPMISKNGVPGWLGIVYDPTMGIGYVLLSNLFASGMTLLLLLPQFQSAGSGFDSQLWKRMVFYAFPLMIAGFAGMINETFDRILIPYLIADKSSSMAQLGIYGACYKLSIAMTLFIQTFRYAAEPFFFSQSTKENPQKIYANVMHMFVLACTLIFLIVMLYIDVFKYFIGPDFRSGLKIVPVLLLANLFLGVYYNLSIWYKLAASTRWGAWISIGGALVTLLFNFLLIPVWGYMGAAWATLICYAAMMAASYFIGQKFYPVPYNVKSFFFYLVLTVAVWGMSELFASILGLKGILLMLFNTVLLLVFVLIAWSRERGKNGYLRHSSENPK